jgi:hypothetical protein
MLYPISVLANPTDIPTLFHHLNMSHEFIPRDQFSSTGQQ